MLTPLGLGTVFGDVSWAHPARPSSQVVQEWVATHSGMWGVGVAMDAGGNSYVTGPSLQDAAHNFREDIVTIKYDPAGNEVWVREFDETGDSTVGSDIPFWIALDPFDNVLITGQSFLDGTGTNFFTLKYDPNGNLLWAARYTGAFEGRRVASDAAGNVYVTGRTGGSSSANYVTVKYDPNGAQLWVKTYNGPSNFRDEPDALAVTADGKVAVTGRSSGAPRWTILPPSSTTLTAMNCGCGATMGPITATGGTTWRLGRPARCTWAATRT